MLHLLTAVVCSWLGGYKQLLMPLQNSKAASRMALTDAAGMVNCHEMLWDLCMFRPFLGEVLSVFLLLYISL